MPQNSPKMGVNRQFQAKQAKNNKKLSRCCQTRATPKIYDKRVGRCAAELLRIFDFQNGCRPPSWFFIFSRFCEKFKFAPISTSSCKIWWRSGYPRPKYCIFSIFKMAAVHHLGFGMTSYRTTHDLCYGPNILLKLHVDRVYTFQDIVIFLFVRFGKKLSIPAPLGGYFPQMNSDIVTTLKRTVLGRKHDVWAKNSENPSTGSTWMCAREKNTE